MLIGGWFYSSTGWTKTEASLADRTRTASRRSCLSTHQQGCVFWCRHGRIHLFLLMFLLLIRYATRKLCGILLPSDRLRPHSTKLDASYRGWFMEIQSSRTCSA